MASSTCPDDVGRNRTGRRGALTFLGLLVVVQPGCMCGCAGPRTIRVAAPAGIQTQIADRAPLCVCDRGGNGCRCEPTAVPSPDIPLSAS